MSRTTRAFYTASAVALCLTLVGLFSPAASAASISYGNFGPVPPGVSFLGVTESSGTDPVPIYGPPSPFSIGLDFNPTNFTASAANGSADLTDGQLNFTVDSNVPITSVDLFERGDYTLAGVGTAATFVQAGAAMFLTVTEINGVAVAPINLPAVNGSFSANLAANPGIVQPWSLGLSGNVGVAGATRVDVVINNAMAAVSQPGTIAFIAKKDFIVDVEIVPEPSTVALASSLLCGLGMAARRKRG